MYKIAFSTCTYIAWFYIHRFKSCVCKYLCTYTYMYVSLMYIYICIYIYIPHLYKRCIHKPISSSNWQCKDSNSRPEALWGAKVGIHGSVQRSLRSWKVASSQVNYNVNLDWRCHFKAFYNSGRWSLFKGSAAKVTKAISAGNAYRKHWECISYVVSPDHNVVPTVSVNRILTFSFCCVHLWVVIDQGLFKITGVCEL